MGLSPTLTPPFQMDYTSYRTSNDSLRHNSRLFPIPTRDPPRFIRNYSGHSSHYLFLPVRICLSSRGSRVIAHAHPAMTHSVTQTITSMFQAPSRRAAATPLFNCCSLLQSPSGVSRITGARKNGDASGCQLRRPPPSVSCPCASPATPWTKRVTRLTPDMRDAFNITLLLGDLQVAGPIAISCVLHRCANLGIRRQK